MNSKSVYPFSTKVTQPRYTSHSNLFLKMPSFRRWSLLSCYTVSLHHQTDHYKDSKKDDESYFPHLDCVKTDESWVCNLVCLKGLLVFLKGQKYIVYSSYQEKAPTFPFGLIARFKTTASCSLLMQTFEAHAL